MKSARTQPASTAQELNSPKNLSDSPPQNSSKNPQKSFTAVEALAFINSLRGEAAKYGHSDSWINHSILVGDCAGKLAEAIKKRQLSASGKTPADSQIPELIDPDHARALGYLHDVGKGLGPFLNHPLTGYCYLKEHNYADEFCSVCLTHSFTNRECEMISGYGPDDDFLQAYIKNHENTVYEDIAALCDLYCNDQVLPLEGRLIDVIIRYGSSEHTAHRLEEIYKLKSKIEQKMGKSVEEVLGLPHFHPLIARPTRSLSPTSSPNSSQNPQKP